MDRSFISNIKFISFIVMRTFACVIVFDAVYLLLMLYSGMKISEISVENVYWMVQFIATFMFLIIQITLCTAYQKIILTLGSRRKDFFMAKYFLVFAVIVITAAVLGGMTYVYDSISIVQYMYSLAMILGVNIITILCANMIEKFGMTGYIIFCVICGFIGGFIGGGVGALMKYKILKSVMVPTALTILATVVMIIVMALDKKWLDSYEIK